MTDHPPAPPESVHLDRLAAELRAQAGSASSGRAARNLLPGVKGLSQTLLALAADAVLADHTTPGPATLQVLVGAVEVTTDQASTRLRAGEWGRIPSARHGLHAERDSVCLLTVAIG